MPVELQMILRVSQKLFCLHSLQDMNAVAYQVVLEHRTHTCQLFASDRMMKLQKKDYSSQKQLQPFFGLLLFRGLPGRDQTACSRGISVFTPNLRVSDSSTLLSLERRLNKRALFQSASTRASRLNKCARPLEQKSPTTDEPFRRT